MKRVLFSLSMACVFFALLSCGSTKELANLSSLNGEWDIVEINGSAVAPVPGQTMPYIGFESTTGKVFGNSGCNRMMGSFDINAKPGNIDLGTMAGTRMLCNDMTTETNVLNVLKNVKGYKQLSNGKMALTNSLNRPIVVLETRILKSQVASLQGEWKITEVNGTAIPSGLEKQPFISFDTAKKSIHGNAGCNIINGGFTLDEKDSKAISFPALAATMMACLNMEIEGKVMSALNEVKSFEILSDTSVALKNEAGVRVIMLGKE